MIDYFISIYEKKIDYYYNNKYLIKDDQIILTDIIFDEKNINNFELITDFNSDLNDYIIENIQILNNTGKINMPKYKYYINIIYYIKYLFNNLQIKNEFNNYISINYDSFNINNYDSIVKYNNKDDKWFVFQKFLTNLNNLSYINLNLNLLVYDYYIGFDFDYNINNLYFENYILNVYIYDNKVIIKFKNYFNYFDYLILYDIIDIFIPCHNIIVNKDNKEIDYEILYELSNIFNFTYEYI
jgi:hypothetical protein